MARLYFTQTGVGIRKICMAREFCGLAHIPYMFWTWHDNHAFADTDDITLCRAETKKYLDRYIDPRYYKWFGIYFDLFEISLASRLVLGMLFN